MTTIEPAPLQELHAIREKMAHELKELSTDERCTAINREAKKFLESKRLGKLIEKFKKAA